MGQDHVATTRGGGRSIRREKAKELQKEPELRALQSTVSSSLPRGLLCPPSVKSQVPLLICVRDQPREMLLSFAQAVMMEAGEAGREADC